MIDDDDTRRTCQQTGTYTQQLLTVKMSTQNHETRCQPTDRIHRYNNVMFNRMSCRARIKRFQREKRQLSVNFASTRAKWYTSILALSNHVVFLLVLVICPETNTVPLFTFIPLSSFYPLYLVMLLYLIKLKGAPIQSKPRLNIVKSYWKPVSKARF